MIARAYAATAALVAALTGPAHAAVLLQDDFDADNTTSALNFNSLINWTVSDGTIDYIRSGGFGIACVGGTGGCLDMDGSSSNAGRITSRSVFDFEAGVTYTLEALISGNQRAGAADSITLGFINEATSVEATLQLGDILAGDPFALRTLSFLPQEAGSYRVFFEGGGGDNVGPILDSVVLSDDSTAPPPGIPEPGTLLLSGLALMGLAYHRRRRQD